MCSTRKKVKIGYVVLGLDTGGLEKLVTSLISGIDRTKYEPYVFCLDKIGIYSEQLKENEVTFFLLKRKPGIDWLLFFRLAYFFRRNKIQIAHLHNATPYFYGVISAKLARVPIIIYTEHDRGFPDKKIISLFNKIFSLLADKITVVCNLLSENLNKYERISKKKIQTIVNGVKDTALNLDINGSLKEELGLDKKDRVIGMVARLSPEKDHQCLLNALSLILEKISNVRLLIVGDGPERERLKRFSYKLGLNQCVLFLGNRNDIPELLSIIDVFVLSSLSEGLSLTLIEAMAASKPIVATEVGGNSELIQNNENGILVQLNHPKALAEAVIELLLNRKKAKQMGERARKIFEERYTLAQMVRNYEKIYDYYCLRKLN